jgi:hypothetical protein
MLNGKWTKENFEIHHNENPEIYNMFCKFAEQMVAVKKHYSAKAIFHRMRWETAINENDSDFKIDDGWISHYARKFLKDYPEHKSFFKSRTLKEGYLD